MKRLQKLLVLCLCFGTAMTYGEQSAIGQSVVPAASPLVLLAGLQARPVRPVRPAPRPRRPATRPSTPIRQPTADLIVTDRAVQARMAEIERQSSRLVERTQRALEEDKKSDKLVARLQKNYGLTFVKVDGRFRLVSFREIIGVNLTDDDRIAAAKTGFRRYRLTNLPATALQLDLLQVPENMPMQEVAARLTAAGATGLFTYNAVYMPAGSTQDEFDEPNADVTKLVEGVSFSIGMIDTAIHHKHKSLRAASITQKNFGRSEELTPRNHGTAIASIITGKGNPTIYAADVFSGPILFSDVESIVRAMDWVAGKGVGVINMSLAGPENPLLAEAVKRLSDIGHIVVAAVGNNGKQGEPLYPASYDNVVGVTAVDTKSRIFKAAYQGRSVDYAALGVKVRAAAIRGSKKYSGTSFASPVIASFIALRYPQLGGQGANDTFRILNARVVDLGLPGHDPVFGIGFLPSPNQ